MQPIDITIKDPSTLVIRWRDGSESLIRAQALRRACPCVICATWRRMTSDSYLPLQSSLAGRIRSIDLMGSTGLLVRWEDGHDQSAYTFDQLRMRFPPILPSSVDE